MVSPPPDSLLNTIASFKLQFHLPLRMLLYFLCIQALSSIRNYFLTSKLFRLLRSGLLFLREKLKKRDHYLTVNCA